MNAKQEREIIVRFTNELREAYRLNNKFRAAELILNIRRTLSEAATQRLIKKVQRGESKFRHARFGYHFSGCC